MSRNSGFSEATLKTYLDHVDESELSVAGLVHTIRHVVLHCDTRQQMVSVLLAALNPRA